MQIVLFHGIIIAQSSLGVPQGSVVGPILFSIYINGIKNITQSTIIIYADDLTLMRPLGSPCSYLELQADLDGCNQWFTKHLLPLNAMKSVTMMLTSGTKNLLPQPLDLGAVSLRVQCTKPLGVPFDNRPSFEDPIVAIVPKARQTSGIVTHIPRGMPQEHLITDTQG